MDDSRVYHRKEVALLWDCVTQMMHLVFEAQM